MPTDSHGATRPRDYFVRHEHGSDRISLEEAQAQPRLPVIGILDRIRSAHNVGAAFRTGDGAGIGELFLCGYTPTPPHRHLSKTALGAVEAVPWRHFEHVGEAVAVAKAAGAQVLALELTETSRSLWEVELDFPVALVVGNEVDGLENDVLQMCDAVVHLPMHGHKNSLNVSVAFGIALYEVVRRFQAGVQPLAARAAQEKAGKI